MYSHFSSTDRSGSQINLAFCSRMAVSMVRLAAYLPAGISDHVPLELNVDAEARRNLGCLRLDTKRLLKNLVQEMVAESGAQYWELNEGSASPQMVWNAVRLMYVVSM